VAAIQATPATTTSAASTTSAAATVAVLDGAPIGGRHLIVAADVVCGDGFIIGRRWRWRRICCACVIVAVRMPHQRRQAGQDAARKALHHVQSNLSEW
jgi:hypothetical protein